MYVYIKSSYGASLQKVVMEGETVLNRKGPLLKWKVTAWQEISKVFLNLERQADFSSIWVWVVELLHWRLTRLQVFAFETALFSLLVWSFPCELQERNTVRSILLLYSSESYIILTTRLFSILHLRSGQSYSYRLLLARTFRCSVTWLISLRLRANRISRAPT